MGKSRSESCSSFGSFDSTDGNLSSNSSSPLRVRFIINNLEMVFKNSVLVVDDFDNFKENFTDICFF